MSRNDEIDIDLSNIENAMVTVNTDINKPVALKNTKPTIFAKPKLKIIPLGGMNEIGKNITVFEYANEIIGIDNNESNIKVYTKFSDAYNDAIKLLGKNKATILIENDLPDSYMEG